MKVLGFSFVAVASLFSMSLAFAGNLPADLEDLNKRWESLAKVDNSQNLMSMEFVQFDRETDVFQLMENYHSEIATGKQIRELHFEKIKEGSRDAVVSALFEKGAKDPAFCAAIPDPKMKVSKTCTPEEQEKKFVKSKSNNCKTKIKEVLGGILHADPEIYFGEFSYADGSSNLVFYVESSFFENSYMKYEFKRS